jgi:hypothetical protein
MMINVPYEKPNWETYNFRTLSEASILSLAEETKNPKVIQQILKTSYMHEGLFKACDSKYATIEGIMEAAQRCIEDHGHMPTDSYSGRDLARLLEWLYGDKRPEIEAYIKATYGIDATGYSPHMLNQLLGTDT